MDRDLLKMELLESFSWAYRDRKTGEKRAAWMTIFFLTLYALAFSWLMFTFYKMGKALCLPMIAQDLEWLFFVLMGLLSIQVVGLTNTFHAYSALKRLKEESALPDSKKAIGSMLLAKFAGTYVMGLFYSLVFMIPGVIVHLQFARPNFIGFIFTLFVPVLSGLLTLVISMLLAWLVYVISSKIRNKNLLTVFLSVCLTVGYYVLYERSQTIFEMVLDNASQVALWTKRLAYPFYQMGLGAQGSILPMVIFCGLVFLIVSMAGFLLWVFYRKDVLKRKAEQNRG